MRLPILGSMLVLVSSIFLVSSTETEPHTKTKICGGDETYCADVTLLSGVKRLQTDSIVTVEQVFGQDPQGTTFGYFGASGDAGLDDADGIGSAGDDIRIQIPAAPFPLDSIYPAVDVTYTVTSGDISSDNPERSVAINLCNTLNADSAFSDAKWKCTVAKDFSLFHIESKLFNEFGTRSSWTLSCTGTTQCQRGFDDIIRRGKPTELSRSPNDPRQGVLAISGTVVSLPGGQADQFITPFLNSGSESLLVDGSVTPVEFKVNAINDFDLYIEQLRCFGGGKGIKFNRFLSKSGAGGLTNGLLIEVKSDDASFQFPSIKTTDNFKNRFSSGGSDFRIDIQSGADQFIAIYKPSTPFPIRSLNLSGFSSPDEITVTVRDNITSGVSALACAAWGFKKEP